MKKDRFPIDFQIEIVQHPLMAALIGSVVFFFIPWFLIVFILNAGEPAQQIQKQPATTQEQPVIKK